MKWLVFLLLIPAVSGFVVTPELYDVTVESGESFDLTIDVFNDGANSMNYLVRYEGFSTHPVSVKIDSGETKVVNLAFSGFDSTGLHEGSVFISDGEQTREVEVFVRVEPRDGPSDSLAVLWVVLVFILVLEGFLLWDLRRD